ncbi:MAG TPA: GNAT family N-acetyltransferase [Clostridiaceae bacterium]|nr:GNAT family N-acetyltransferase [Clostridiaceae bacterium]
MQNLDIRKLDGSHYIEAIKLSAYAFQFKVTDEEIKNRIKSMENQDILGYFEDGKLVSKLSIRPFQIWLNEQKVKMGGIASVATYPEYRRKGCVKELLRQSLVEMRKNGQIISVLHPFSYGFYRKFGWEHFADFIKIHLTGSDLKPSDNVPGYVNRVDKDSCEQIEDLEKIYNKYAQKYIGMFVRDRNWWKETVINDRHAAIYYNQFHEPLGYLIYSIQNFKMFVKEFIPLNHEARKGIWNFICQHDSMLRELELWAEVNDLLLFTIINPKVKVEHIAFPMVRVVDVRQFLQIYPFSRQNPDCRLSIKITDEYAPWNNGTFTIKPGVNGNKVTVDASEGNLSMSINTLSTLLFKYKTASELYECELIKGDHSDVCKLDSMLPNKKPRFLDAF